MKLQLPPHIAWPLFVVLLMLTGIGTTFALLFASKSDGGAQVVENYYQKATTWDTYASERAASAALGWKAEVSVLPPDDASTLRPVEVLFQDRDGAPLTGLTGIIRALRPQQARAVAEVPLAPAADKPGAYRMLMPVYGAGLWDFEIAARRDTLLFQTTLRRELSR